MRTKHDPDDYYDRRVDRILEAQENCPYLKRNEEPFNEEGDKLQCLQDMEPCQRRRHCIAGKW